MIIYNVTVKIANAHHDDWLDWMKTVHIPDVLNTGMFVDNQMCKILEDDPEGKTYAIQYKCRDMDTFLEYQNKFAEKLQAEHTERYKNQYVAFRTLMEIVE